MIKQGLYLGSSVAYIKPSITLAMGTNRVLP
nr:MAG TPA: hypothetical protein [Bacteriophage sp.]DAS00117.1 MAG TPA: hypothetical protein [Caudoviricetes sp.]DAW93309.1 MAG TPA: hypothetical protein [Caudoviricetes sp.]